jgi:fatty-acyl-CoA synthase
VNIYSREVEDALYNHAGVLEAAVIGVPHQTWGETVHAVIVRRPGATVTEAEIIEHCRTLIASFKKPTSVSFLSALPKLPNGKVDKVALREPFWAGYARRVN